MLAESFVTHSLPKSQQLGAWRAWYDTIFDVTPALSAEEGFTATNSTWTIPGLTLSSVASPANTVNRTKTVIRNNPVDHWVITLSKRSVSDVATRGFSLEAPPGTPFVISLADEVAIRRREHDERMQILLARDSFETIAPLLDAARGISLTTPGARMMADYLLLLEKNLPALPPEDAERLKNAVQAMLAACLAPTAEGVAVAKDQIRLTLMERVRQAVRRNLQSPSLGPDKLCREAATSRSQLYRLLESEGGVANYIQRRRLSEAFSMLCDVANNRSIGKVAEMLCFADASTFARAFRREFGMSPSDVRAISATGVPPALAPKRPTATDVPRTFSDCLRAL